MNRKRYFFDGEELLETITFDVTWEQVRDKRDVELMKSDVQALPDRNMSQEWIDYRQFLRDLPQNYDTANEAADAWNEYEIPEN